MKSSSIIVVLIGGMLALDATIAVVAFAAPGLWFQVFHGTAAPADLLYFRRTGAQWAGFALVQAIAIVRWREQPLWLAAVAGVRLCDAFTDWTAIALMHDRTAFAWLALIAVGPANVVIAWYLFTRARELRVSLRAG